MNYRTLKLRRLRLRRLAAFRVYQRRQRYFTVTLFITIYLTTKIVNKLRARENELEEANNKLEEQDRVKSKYILRVSHDLKSSLAAIQSCLNVVLRNIVGSISKKTRDMISRAEQRTKSLLQFVNELLELSSIRIIALKEMIKEKICLFDIIKNQIDFFKPMIEQKKIRIRITNNTNNNTYVNINVKDVDLLFSNLISNAIRYTPRAGRISLSLNDVNGKNKIQVAVIDSGIGIPKDDLSNIFEDFFRAKNAKIYEKNGTGLGLAIVKQIIERYKGKIWVESEEGKGTKFILILPKMKGERNE